MRRAFLLACALVAASCRAERRAVPLTLQDDWQRAVQVAAAPQRVVSLSPATTELVFALGAGNRLVGRTTWCDWPAEAGQVTDVGNGIGINVEAVAAQRPDLVLLYPSESNRAAAAQLEQLGIPVAALKQDAIADWRATVRWVARALGDSARGDSLLADFDRRPAAARAPQSDSSAHPPSPIPASSSRSAPIRLSRSARAASSPNWSSWPAAATRSTIWLRPVVW